MFVLHFIGVIDCIFMMAAKRLRSKTQVSEVTFKYGLADRLTTYERHCNCATLTGSDIVTVVRDVIDCTEQMVGLASTRIIGGH